MKVFYPPHHKRHMPKWYLADGTVRPSPENPKRVGVICDALRADSYTVEPVLAGGSLAPIAAVHTANYLEFLQNIHARWTAEFGRDVDVMPDTFSRRINTASRPEKPAAQAGYYCFDMAAPINSATFDAAVESAQCAVAATEALLAGDRAAYALCRPPGHHAGADYCGGFCYLNNAAIAAQLLRDRGMKRVAILDIDYHHGNGTQDIFYRRSDVFFSSIHADPNTQYPYFWGYADEIGEGKGKGYTANFPLPRGSSERLWLKTLDAMIARAKTFRPEALVISLGADIHEADTVGDFKVSTTGFYKAAKRIAALKIPSLIVQEGGYNLENIGSCAAEFLSPF